MTKKELRAEIEKLQKAYGLRYYGGINSMKKAELESFLDDIKYAHSLKCNTEPEKKDEGKEGENKDAESEKKDEKDGCNNKDSAVMTKDDMLAAIKDALPELVQSAVKEV